MLRRFRIADPGFHGRHAINSSSESVDGGRRDAQTGDLDSAMETNDPISGVRRSG